jgi:hypothetical protein
VIVLTPRWQQGTKPVGAGVWAPFSVSPCGAGAPGLTRDEPQSPKLEQRVSQPAYEPAEVIA